MSGDSDRSKSTKGDSDFSALCLCCGNFFRTDNRGLTRGDVEGVVTDVPTVTLLPSDFV